MKQFFSAQAPSNIAIIKYMGKKERRDPTGSPSALVNDASANLPENGSLSVTLEDLCTLAELEESEMPGNAPAKTFWVAEKPAIAHNWKPKHLCAELTPAVPALSDAGSAKVLRHVERVFEACTDLLPAFNLAVRDLKGRGFVLRTANTFPQASGIASSASAFAAVTLVAAQARAESPAAFASLYATDRNFRRALAALSRRGSGSSCRSFEGPWVEWEDERAFVPETRLNPLAHFVVVVSDREKRVSSSQAHALIKTSPLWNGRVDRVNARLHELRAALRENALPRIAKLAWGEAWEMHSLFHTCADPFTYWEPGSVQVLNALGPALGEAQPPVMTMDAGPNVHVLVDESLRAAWRTRLRETFPGVRILEDGEGAGARLLGELK